MKAFYSKLYAPFIAISSNIIFLLEKNESFYSVMHIISALKFGDFAIKCFDEKKSFNSSFQLMAIVLKIQSINGINYSRPNLSKYQKISQYLTNCWQKEKFNESNANIFSMPLPSFREKKNIFHQEESFYTGFKFVISDFLDNLIKSNSRIKINNPENICNFFSQICNIDIFDDELLKKASYDFFTQTICDIVHNIYNNEMPQKFDLVFHNYLSSQKKYRLSNDIILVENDLLKILEKCLLIEFDNIIHQKIKEECFQIDEVKSEISELKKKISEKVKNRLPDLISDIKAMIISKAKYIKLSIMKEVDIEYENIRQKLYNIQVLQYTPTKKKELFNLFNNELLPMANNMMNNKIKPDYFNHVIELYDIKNSMCDEINQKIDSGLPNIQIEMNKKKKIQIAAKVGIGTAAGLVWVALIGTGIGAAAGAAVAAGTAATCAGTAAAAGATAVASAGAAAASATAVASAGAAAAGATAVITASATTATAVTGATIASTAGVGAAIGAGVGAGVGAVAGGVTGGLIKKPNKENTS